MIINTLEISENRSIFYLRISGNKYPSTSLIDAKSTHLVNSKEHRWTFDKLGYVKCSLHGELFHRLVIGAKRGEIVDHINRNTKDNREKNLRVVSHQQNMQNREAANNALIPIKGVYLDKNKWRAEIHHNGRKIHLGNYEDIFDAVMVRIKKEYELYGEYSLNYRNILKTIPLIYKRYWLPEIFGKENIRFIDSNFHKAFFKNEKEGRKGMLKKLNRYAKYGNGKK